MPITINGNGTVSGITAGLTAASMPAGSVLQVQQTVLTNAIEEAVVSNTYEDIAGFTCNITPQTGSKVLVYYIANTSTTSGQYNCKIQLVRGSTAIAQGDQIGSNRQRATTGQWSPGDAYHILPQSMMFLDASPGGDGSTPITYKLQWTDSYGQNLNLNRMDGTADTTNDFSQVSSITLLEVAA